MKKNCLFIFHDWTEWEVDTDEVIQIYRYDTDKRPTRRTRKIIQTRQCQTCKVKQYKKTEITV